MLQKLIPYRYFILLVALINLILTPLVSDLFRIQGGLLTLINFTIIILASIITAQRKKVRFITVSIGVITLAFIWLEFFNPSSTPALCRMFSTLILFCIVTYILIRNFIDAKEIDLSVIFGAMAGYILIGVIGGILFEILDFFDPNAIQISPHSGSYDYYYYSFISLVTVGFGDIIPISAAAKSLTIILSILGQFYMVVGISLFVGKHLNKITK